MKKILNIRNVTLIIALALIVMLTSTKEVKAAGTVTWSGPSSITIRETIRNIANPIVASRNYYLNEDFGSYNNVATATINHTTSDTITNNTLTKSSVVSLANLSFDEPGDYNYELYDSGLIDAAGRRISDYFPPVKGDLDKYEIIVSVRNVVDANNVPTGNFTASLILKKFTYNEQTGEPDEEKVSPVSGVLYADFDQQADQHKFGHIEISKTVKGIGADTTKYFPIAVYIDNTPTSITAPLDADGYVYSITGIDATVTYNGTTINNPTTITTNSDDPTFIYLKHGQTAVIGQVTRSGGGTFDAIPFGEYIAVHGGFSSKGTVFQALEVDNPDAETLEPPEDYAVSFSINDGSVVNDFATEPVGVNTSCESSADTTCGRATTVDFINTKEMSPVTGLIFTIIPYVLMAGIGIGGVFAFNAFKNNKQKEKSS